MTESVTTTKPETEKKKVETVREYKTRVSSWIIGAVFMIEALIFWGIQILTGWNPYLIVVILSLLAYLWAWQVAQKVLTEANLGWKLADCVMMLMILGLLVLPFSLVTTYYFGDDQ